MRTIEEIYQALLASFAERAGFQPEEGCDLAVRLYAAAAQVQALEIQGEWVLDQSFPQTAQGVYLDRHGTMRGLTRTAAAKAVGTLRFSVTTASAADVTIPADTVCMTAAGVRFRTLSEGTLTAGTLTADVAAEAVEPGSGGNAATGTVNILAACPVSITGCTNPAPFTGGSDQEEDEAFRQRILESYQRLPNGANAAWYEQTAMGHSGVAAAQAVGRARGIGTVDVYVATESGVPDSTLLSAIQAELQEKREIAVDVQALAPEVEAVDVTVEVTARENPGFTQVKAAVETAIATFFDGKLLGRALRLAELGDRIYRVEGVENYHLLAPTADLAAEDGVLPVLGTLTVTELEA
ncbi:baseplate J/gp47 family protein [Dysosmobacter sp.]|uniref:baseplate J/gp47 family protein n=1 Tax=Dysosmobacter sp. TaxID=2591382 RepID=UPI002A85E675|nr:baseplate J/gp47 family protein [Dysosmobacter sp.]MDY3985138.1 baseplate J/gp47 family protein [Dysosmobacter sp.]